MLYDHPDNLFVAAFIGSPAMNLYEASVSPEADQVRIGSQSLALSEHLLAARPALRGYRDRKVVVGVRPEDLHDGALEPAPAPASTLLADVELIEALGNELQVHFLVEATRARSQDTAAATETAELEGASLRHEGARSEGVARVSPRSMLKAGSKATFVVDTDRLHFFDPEDGSAVWN